MASTLLTINMITREAIRLWHNTNSFIQFVDRQYDNSFAQTGAKIGTALRIRLPNDYVVRTGRVASPQDTAEASTTLVVATQKGVDLVFSSVDRTMSLDDFSKRVLAPAVNNLVGAVALDVMTGADGGVEHLVANTDGSGNLLSPNATTLLNAGAVLDSNSTPMGQRFGVLDPFTQARVVSSLAGLFNPSTRISQQYNDAQMKSALGFDWMMDQTVLKHTNGTFSAGTVNGANQTGSTLVVNAITGTLNAGDVITIAGVYGVNRITKQTTGALRQFVVTANVASGATQIPIYPAIIPAGPGGAQVQYQTVVSSPANSAALALVLGAGITFRKNIVLAPEAVTMATADLELPKGVHEAARESFDGTSMRMITAYDITNDNFITRLDVLYGYLWVKPEWSCAVADVL